MNQTMLKILFWGSGCLVVLCSCAVFYYTSSSRSWPFFTLGIVIFGVVNRRAHKLLNAIKLTTTDS